MVPRFYTMSRMGLQKDWYFELPKRGKIPEETLWRYAIGIERPNELTFAIKGTKRTDVVLVEGLFFAAEDRVFDSLRSNKFSGYSSFPISLPKKYGFTYHGLAFTGKAGPNLGDAITKPECFSLKTWDGSDFFILQDTRRKIITERVYQCFQAANISGAFFRPISVVD